MKKSKLIVITGPTASGKSALAVSLAQKFDTEIISADSRQIYKGIPIVTAVPSLEEQGGITHHLIETLPLDAYYSAARFQEDAMAIIDSLFKEKEFVIVCGGSMLYIDALVKGIDELPTVPEDIRNTLMKEWQKKGDDWLLTQLSLLDPDYLKVVDRKNMKRIFHAVEISLTAKVPYSSLLTSRNKMKKDFPYEVVKFCLSGDRASLFERINKRTISMIEAGLEEEARRVYPLKHLNSLNTVGLKEMFLYFEGKFTREEAIARIQKNTRVYAKKQITWHKRDSDISYLDFSDSPETNAKKVLELVLD